MLKPPKSFSEQIHILIDRDMLVEDVEASEVYLSRRNYYRLNAYFHHFLVGDRFNRRVSFEDIIMISETDSLLRHCLFGYLESIELRMRTQIGYVTGMLFGADAFYTGDCFYEQDREDALELLTKIHDEIRHRYRKDPAIKHHKNRYNGKQPVWVTVEYLGFGSVSKIFRILDGTIQASIAKEFGVQTNLLQSWIHCLSVFRNICAHHGYLFRKKLDIQAMIPRKYMGTVRNNEVFTTVFCINSLLPKDERSKFCAELTKIEQNIDSANYSRYQVRLGDYGFPMNWQNILG